MIASVALAAWLDRGIVARLRALARGMDEGLTTERAGRPLNAWGEVGAVARGIDALLAQRKRLIGSLEDLERLKRDIAIARESIERWSAGERWQAPATEDVAIHLLVEALKRGFARQREVGEQNHEAARQVQGDVVSVMAAARESSEHAEHGFVEATAALTSVNELQRLAGELQQGMIDRATTREGAARPDEAWRGAAIAAIEELAGAAGESVEHLATGFLRVQEIGEQVHLLSNRATLIALHTLLTGSRPEEATGANEGMHAELKQLALEVRSATSRVGELSHELEREIQAATERMRGIRERVTQRLEQIPESVEPAEPAIGDARRLLERLREMAQDSSRKSERVTRSAELASRAIQEIVKRLEEENADLEGLIVRLSPAFDEGAQARTRESEPGGSRPSGLRVVERRGPSSPNETKNRGGEIA